MKISKICLTKSQKKTLLKIRQGKNVFIQGVAGTGKTHLLKQIKNYTQKNVILYGTTGMSAMNLGGVTVSSKNGLSLFCYNCTDMEIKENNPKWRSYRSYMGYRNETEKYLFVIDEIGFLSEDQFRQIDVALRSIGNTKEFMGGFQIVLAGDFRQMPSICWGESLEKSNYMKKFEHIELIENVRQKEDVPFFNILNIVRNNGIDKNVKNFLFKNSKKEDFKKTKTTIVATRSLMDTLNNKIVPPTEFVELPVERQEGKEETEVFVKFWVGMPVLITRNSNGVIYNGDTAVIEEIVNNEICLKIDRTGQLYWISYFQKEWSKLVTKEFFVTGTYTEWNDYCEWSDEIFSYLDIDGETRRENICLYNKKLEDLKINEVNILQKTEYFSYDYMSLLPAYHLSIRRCQGLTLKKGILHESILNASKYNEKDAINIQYVALSRFEKIKNVKIDGFNSPNSLNKFKTIKTIEKQLTLKM